MKKKKIKQIKKDHPSICYNCKLARRPASEENLKKGYVGCCLRVIDKPHTNYDTYDYDEINEGKEVGEGWVDLKSRPFNKPSGVISNLQLITLEIKSCSKYESR